MDNFASGKDGKAVFGGTTLQITGWTYRETGKANDTTHTGTGGVETSLVGTVKYSGTFKANFDLDAQPQDDVPGLYAGRVGALNLYVSTEAYYAFTQVEIQEISIDSEVSGLVSYSATWQSRVAPTVPGATAQSPSSSESSSSDSASSSSSLAG